MNLFRFNQGWQKAMEDVQRGAFRPTCAEKVRRLEHALSLNPSNLLTSSNLAAHTHPPAPAYIHTRAHACVYIPVRWVRRLDSSLFLLMFFRPTCEIQVRRHRKGLDG